MKKILLSIVFSFFALLLSAQFVYKIKADSVLITNDSCTAELIIENRTKDTLGFLYNKGKGRTEFRSGSGTFILNQNSVYQPASYRIAGSGMVRGGFSSTSPYGIGNERMGDSALASLTAASNKNIAFGYKALKKWNQPYGNMIAIGAHALENLDTLIDSWGDEPGTIAIGVNAMKNYKISNKGMWDDNVAIGYNAMRGSDTVTSPIGGYNVNVAIGAHSLENITTGVQNVYVGGYSGSSNTSGTDNVLVGSWTGSLTTGSINVGMGTFALGGIVTGSENVGIGSQVFGEGSSDRKGSIGIGYQIGRYGGGDSSIYIGHWSGWYENHHNEFLLSHYGRTLLLGEFNGRKALKPQGAMVFVTEAATDANYTANQTAYYIILPSITANRTLTIPAASSNIGRQIKIFNKNSSANSWSFASAIKTPSGANVTTMANESCMFLFSDGTNWINVLAADNGSMKPIQSKSISLQSPTSSENVSIWYTTQAITIQEVRGVMLGSSQSVTLTLNYGSNRASASGTIVASNTFDSGDSGYQTTGFAFTLNNTSIPAGSYIWLTTSAAGGTINDLNITVTYK